MMGPIICAETSVGNYNYKLRNARNNALLICVAAEAWNLECRLMYQFFCDVTQRRMMFDFRCFVTA